MLSLITIVNVLRYLSTTHCLQLRVRRKCQSLLLILRNRKACTTSAPAMYLSCYHLTDTKLAKEMPSITTAKGEVSVSLG